MLLRAGELADVVPHLPAALKALLVVTSVRVAQSLTPLFKDGLLVADEMDEPLLRDAVGHVEIAQVLGRLGDDVVEEGQHGANIGLATGLGFV